MKLEFKQRTLIIIFILLFAIIFGIEYSQKSEKNASLLFVLSYCVKIVEGCIALAAIGEMTKAKWLEPIKKELLSLSSMLLFYSLLFHIIAFQMKIYPWSGNESLWLNRNFFLARNFIILIAVYLFAKKFATESLNGGKKRGFYAVLYLFAFVISQSLVAFDWIMSLAYPWISTLLGGYFFVEAVYSGIAVGGIFYFFLIRESSGEVLNQLKTGLKDISTLLFGFSLVWVGLFYAQFLVIWYGNIPEETSFILERVSKSPFLELSYMVLMILFFVPFITLLSIKVKVNPYIILSLSVLVLAGFLAENYLIIAPLVHVKPVVAVIEFTSLLFLFILLVINRGKRQDCSSGKAKK